MGNKQNKKYSITPGKLQKALNGSKVVGFALARARCPQQLNSTSTYFAPSETKTTYLFCISPYFHYFSRDRIFS